MAQFGSDLNDKVVLYAVGAKTVFRRQFRTWRRAKEFQGGIPRSFIGILPVFFHTCRAVCRNTSELAVRCTINRVVVHTSTALLSAIDEVPNEPESDQVLWNIMIIPSFHEWVRNMENIQMVLMYKALILSFYEWGRNVEMLRIEKQGGCQVYIQLCYRYPEKYNKNIIYR